MITLLATVLIFFSPHGGCTDAIIGEIAKAKTNVRLQAYSFTNERIEKALEAAQKRGAAVQVILDRSWQNQSPKIEARLVAAGIPVLIDARHPISHNKIIVIDNNVVITGSMNFTVQGESNAENVVVLAGADGRKAAPIYNENWLLHAAHSAVPSAQMSEVRNQRSDR